MIIYALYVVNAMCNILFLVWFFKLIVYFRAKLYIVSCQITVSKKNSLLPVVDIIVSQLFLERLDQPTHTGKLCTGQGGAHFECTNGFFPQAMNF